MIEDMKSSEEDSPSGNPEPARRLCSEIQLFDLCDLERCKYKNGQFCINEELLTRFEKIVDRDENDRFALADEDLDEEDDEYGSYGFDDGPDDYSGDEEDY